MRLTLVKLVRRVKPDPMRVQSGLGTYTVDYSNLPERYLKRKISKVEWKTPDGPEFQKKMRVSGIPRHTMDRPWSQAFWQKNPPFGVHDIVNDNEPIVMPIKDDDWMWFRGDRVEILKGEDKGKQGYINYIVQERNWVTVEGLNCDYKTVGEKGEFPGMMFKEEKPLLVNRDIRLVDPTSEKGCAFEWKYTESGERLRVSMKSGTVLPLPAKMDETIDYKTKKGYKGNDIKDTKPADVEEITFEPKLATFEMDIMESMGIKEDRKAAKTWWY